MCACASRPGPRLLSPVLPSSCRLKVTSQIPQQCNVKICHLPPEIGAQLFPTNLGLSMLPMYIRWRWAQFNVTITILLHRGNGILSSKMLDGRGQFERKDVVRFTKYMYINLLIYILS